MVYNLVLDDDVLNKYNEYYFKEHKGAKKVPIESPRHPSLNVWAIMRRFQANALKQKWADFMVWWIESLGYTNLKLDRVEMKFKTYMPTKRKADPDNTVPKYMLDGFVAGGMIAGDDYTHIDSLILQVGYDKDHPRTEIEIKEIKGEKV